MTEVSPDELDSLLTEFEAQAVSLKQFTDKVDQDKLRSTIVFKDKLRSAIVFGVSLARQIDLSDIARCRRWLNAAESARFGAYICEDVGIFAPWPEWFRLHGRTIDAALKADAESIANRERGSKSCDSPRNLDAQENATLGEGSPDEIDSLLTDFKVQSFRLSTPGDICDQDSLGRVLSFGITLLLSIQLHYANARVHRSLITKYRIRWLAAATLVNRVATQYDDLNPPIPRIRLFRNLMEAVERNLLSAMTELNHEQASSGSRCS